VHPKDRARTRAKATERILDLMAEYAQGRPFGHVAILHADSPEVAVELRRLATERFSIRRLIEAEIGPVIGTYVGPGAYGMTFHCD
jgi:fatty acid-binding protein DegV